jgi:CBS domain containing-hemolysin-like protein
LQKMEYQLLKTSLDFRDLEVGEYLVPWKKVICLTSEMTFPEVQKIYSRHLFSNYPVLDEKKKVVGLFNYKMFAWARIKKKNPLWQEYLIKEITVSPQMSLSQLFRKLQESKCQMAIVKQKGWNVGIITKKIILEVLIGEEIQNEEDKLR